MALPIRIKISFVQKIKYQTTGCWEWTAALSDNGYGKLGLNDGSNYYAHRVAYELFFGEVPEDKIVCHHCDNRKCVRPDHLFLGTQQDNMDDMIEKGRAAHGDRHPMAKLSMEKAKQIRLLYSHGAITLEELGAMFSVSRRSIANIIHNRIWKE